MMCRCAPSSTCCCHRRVPGAPGRAPVLCHPMRPAPAAAAGRATGQARSGRPCHYRRGSSSWSGARRSQARSGTPSTSSSTGASAASRSPSASPSRSAGHAQGEVVTCWCRCPSIGPDSRERGFDEADDIARACGRRLGLPVARALERRHRTVAQHSLGRVERARNLGGAFGVRDGQRAGSGAAGSSRRRRVHHRRDAHRVRHGPADSGALAVSALTVARER